MILWCALARVWSPITVLRDGQPHQAACSCNLGILGSWRTDVLTPGLLFSLEATHQDQHFRESRGIDGGIRNYLLKEYNLKFVDKNAFSFIGVYLTYFYLIHPSRKSHEYYIIINVMYIGLRRADPVILAAERGRLCSKFQPSGHLLLTRNTKVV